MKSSEIVGKIMMSKEEFSNGDDGRCRGRRVKVAGGCQNGGTSTSSIV